MVSDLRKKRSRSDLRRQLHVRGDFRRCVLTTGEDGKVTFNGLQVKNQNVTVLYRITEVRTKNGFQLLGEPLFEGSLPQDVNGTPQQDITITAVNGQQFELPAAGRNGMQSAATGMVFAVIGLFGLLYVQKEKF